MKLRGWPVSRKGKTGFDPSVTDERTHEAMVPIKPEYKGKNGILEDPETLIWLESYGAINA